MQFNIRNISVTVLFGVLLGFVGYWSYLWLIQIWLSTPTPRFLSEMLGDMDSSTRLQYLELYGFLARCLLAAIPLTVAGFILGRYGKLFYWIALTVPIVFISVHINHIASLDLNEAMGVTGFPAPLNNMVWFELIAVVVLPFIAFLWGRKLRKANHSKQV